MTNTVQYRIFYILFALLLTGSLSFLSYTLFVVIAKEVMGVSVVFFGFIGGILVCEGFIGRFGHFRDSDWFSVVSIVIVGSNLTGSGIETAQVAYLVGFGYGLLRQAHARAERRQASGLLPPS